jgi:hypothetical protein
MKRNAKQKRTSRAQQMFYVIVKPLIEFNPMKKVTLQV